MYNTVPCSSQPARILVVEDEYFVAADLAQALKGAGAEVVGPVPTDGEALALLASGAQVDGAVLDINLRGELVYPLADVLIEREVPFVFATGYGADVVPRRFSGVPRWEKPFDYRALAEALPGVLRAA